MMKIPVPLGSTEVEQVSRRVRDQWLQQDAHAVGAQSDPRRAAHNSLPSGFAPRETSSLSPPALSPPATSPRQATSPVALPPPPLHPSRSSGSGPAVATFPPPPPFPPAPSSRQASREEAASGSRVGPWSLNFSMNGISFRRSSSGGTSPPAVSAPPPPRTGHRCSCDNCGTYLAGTRYQCANCPSDPAAFNLVRRFSPALSRPILGLCADRNRPFACLSVPRVRGQVVPDPRRPARLHPHRPAGRLPRPVTRASAADPVQRSSWQRARPQPAAGAGRRRREADGRPQQERPDG